MHACSRHAPGAGPITEERIDGCDALPDPAHDRNRHRVAKCFVARSIGCELAAILDQRVVVGESLQPFALTRRQPPHGHLRRHYAIEPSIRILAPIVGVRRKKDEEAEKDITKQNERVLVGFRNAYVFDVSQTEGVDLPTMHEVSGDPGENLGWLAAFVRGRGIQLVYNPNIAPALGMSYGGRIAILPGQTKAEEFSTLIHETAHELLHKAERRTATTKTVRETEAEAVAFVVSKAVGLVTGSASADYIQLYHGNASLLAESLEVIHQTSAVILAALEPPIEEHAAQTTTEELAEVAA